MAKKHIVRKAQKRRRRHRQDYFREHGHIYVKRPEPPRFAPFEKMLEER